MLQKVFGYPDFRPAQQKVVDRILRGDPLLALLPTGGGKSLCYQVPALVTPGLAIVVSPLIALMKDQVDALRRHGLKAAAFHSALKDAEQREIIAALDDPSGLATTTRAIRDRAVARVDWQHVAHAYADLLLHIVEAGAGGRRTS